ncbi:MAG: tRNA guanosine(34) transglycosylase Tgt, partial [Patescibacteria group bacterium]
LDVCTPWPCTYDDAKHAVDMTLDWARRSKKQFDTVVRRKKLTSKNRPRIFGIVQGSLYKDLRKYCIDELTKLDFDGYGIGGVAPKKKVTEFVEWCTDLLPKDKPRYLMGVGRPEDIVEAVAVGVDMFDCVIPTREAPHGLLYVKKSRIKVAREVKKLFYDTVRIIHETYRNDFRPIDPKCSCMTCQTTTRAYLRHLFVTQETLYLRYASIHNLAFYLDMMKELQKRNE